MILDHALIPHAIRKASNRGYAAPVDLPDHATDNPFLLGRLAAQAQLPRSRFWPERIQAGWDYEQSQHPTPTTP